MKLEGTIYQILDATSGTSQTGKEWTSQDFVIKTLDEKYPKYVCMNVFNNQFTIPPVGTTIEVQFEVESTQWKEKWYTKCKAWKVELKNISENIPVQEPAQSVGQSGVYTPIDSASAPTNPFGKDDLPF